MNDQSDNLSSSTIITTSGSIFNGVDCTYQRRFDRRRKSNRVLFQFLCGVCAFLAVLCVLLIIVIVFLYPKSDSIAHLAYKSAMGDIQSDDAKYRLPKDVKPIHYDLFLHPNLETGLFKGNVTILIDVLSTKNYISLHQKDLNITKTTLKTYDKEENYEISVGKIHTIKELDELVVTFNKNLDSGVYQLSFEFDGALQPNKIVGFYSSQYVNSDKVTRKIATSKFEPTYARRAFPCFDEPHLKAEYTVRLVHPNDNGYNALSNMDVESTVNNKPEYGLTTVTFSKSVPMSTYLTCFIVSDFVALTGTAKKLDGTSTFPISVYTTVDQKKKAKLALDIGIEIIEYYTNLFKIDYSLPKLDLAAIPDFVSGAMENYGLITYREARLLYDEAIHSKVDKENVASIIAHEFAHMWFGNLVTMEWWNDLWLNEGFASFMQYKSVDAIRPEWRMMETFVLATFHNVFVTDAKLSSHPIVQIVNSPDEITALFDVITYEKGAAVLCMMDNFLTSDIFNAGVITYLNQFQFRNAKTSDLFNILQKSVGNKINLTSIMNTWTKQMGFPVVTVNKNGPSNFTLTQKRFLLDPEAKFDPTESEYRYKWTIPVTYITDKNSTPTLIWFDKDDMNLELKFKEPVEWIKFNHNQTGYYRIKYGEDDWNNLLKVLKSNHKTLTSIDRANLIEDAFSLAEATEIDYKIAMDMTLYLMNERNSTPWRVAAKKLLTLDTLLFSTNITSKYRDYVKKIIVTDIYSGVDDFNNHDILKLRNVIFDLACTFGHKAIINEVVDTFKKWISSPDDIKIDSNLKSIYYQYGMKYIGTEHEWDIVYLRFVNETNAAEKLKLMRSLAAVRSSHLLNKFINIAIDQTIVRSQDTFNCFIAIAKNPIGTPLVWDWIRENWLFLVEKYTLNDRNLGRLIPDITKTFASEAKLEEMKNFFKKYPESGAGKDYRIQALETVSNNIKWLKTNSGKIDKWLDSYFKQ